jgi:hypothetical protein
VLTGREDEFICDMQLLNGWNKKCYENNYVLDGTMWNLLFIYDDVKVFAQGSNGFPKEFLEFLHLLHNVCSRFLLPHGCASVHICCVRTQ